MIYLYLIPLLIVLIFTTPYLFSKKKSLAVDSYSLFLIAFVPLANIIMAVLIVFAILVSIKDLWRKS